MSGGEENDESTTAPAVPRSLRARAPIFPIGERLSGNFEITQFVPKGAGLDARLSPVIVEAAQRGSGG